MKERRDGSVSDCRYRTVLCLSAYKRCICAQNTERQWLPRGGSCRRSRLRENAVVIPCTSHNRYEAVSNCAPYSLSLRLRRSQLPPGGSRGACSDLIAGGTIVSGFFNQCVLEEKASSEAIGQQKDCHGSVCRAFLNSITATINKNAPKSFRRIPVSIRCARNAPPAAAAMPDRAAGIAACQST